MIRFHHTEGTYRPVICCDICHGLIEDARLGAVLAAGTGEWRPVCFAHKGACHDAAESQLRPGETRGWVELMTFILQLTYNAGLTPEELVAWRDRLGSLPPFSTGG